jgi:CRISPR-associated protein Csm3
MRMHGKVIITGKLKALTGLHIGAASTGLEIGGVDKVVVRNPLDNRPYVPGSSLKGKLRALLERAGGFADPAKRVWLKKDEVSIHLCGREDCYLCTIFGRNNGKQTTVTKQTIEIKRTTPTRLLVRDGWLDDDSLRDADTDLPFTEVKWEVGIDRITSAANPRQLERVPAGAVFSFEMIYTIYNPADRANLKRVFEAMHWLEDDTLGGQGSRGSGKVAFEAIAVRWNPAAYYQSGNGDDARDGLNGDDRTVSAILANFDALAAGIELPERPPRAGEAAAEAEAHAEAHAEPESESHAEAESEPSGAFAEADPSEGPEPASEAQPDADAPRESDESSL